VAFVPWFRNVGTPPSTPFRKAPWRDLFALGVVARCSSRTVGSPPRQKPPSRRHNAPRSTPPPTPQGRGLIEYHKIPLEVSEEIFLDRGRTLKKPKWFFENHSAAQVADLFRTPD